MAGKSAGRAPRDGQGGLGNPRGVRTLVYGLALATLLLRLAAGLLLARSPLVVRPVLEDAAYREQAVQLVEGGWIPSTLPWMTPGYSALAAAVPGVVHGSQRALLVAQALAEALCVLVLASWAARRFGRGAALVAGGLYLLDPLGATFASRFSPVTFGTLGLLGLAVWIDRLRERERRGAVWLGPGAVGAATFLLLPLHLLCYLGWLLRELLLGRTSAGEKPARRPAEAAWLVGPTLVTLAAVLAIHASLPGGAPALSAESGLAMHRAWDPATGGTARALVPPSWISQGTTLSVVWEGLGREGTSGDVARFFATRGFQQIVENPVAMLGLLLGKTAATLGAWPVPDALSPAFLLTQYGGPFVYGLFSFALLFGLGLAGWIALRRARGWDGDELPRLPGSAVAALGATLLACLLGETSAAARQPALPFLALAAGAWLSSRARLARPAVLAAVLAIIGSVALGWLSPASALRNPSEDFRLTASAFQDQRSTRQAESFLEDAIRANPRNADAHVSLAANLQRDGLTDAAEKELLTAYAADSLHPGTLLALGRMKQSRRELEEASYYMSRLVQMRPNNPLFLNELGQVFAQLQAVAEAQALFAQALRLKPDYDVARQNLEAIETLKRRMEDSLYPPEMRLPPDDPAGMLAPNIVGAMDRQEWATADSLIAFIERERPGHVLAPWLRAAYLARRGDQAGAIAALELCNRLAPGRATIVTYLAGYYVQLGRRADAEALFRNALAAAAGEPTRVEALERARETVLQAPPN